MAVKRPFKVRDIDGRGHSFLTFEAARRRAARYAGQGWVARTWTVTEFHGGRDTLARYSTIAEDGTVVRSSVGGI